MKANWIDNPFAVWDHIKAYLADDSGELETEGRFIGVFDDNILSGAFLVKPWNNYCFEMHGGVLPQYWGRGPEICDLAGRSLFHSTSCLKIVAIIPEFNRLMRKCVQRIGMRQEGVITQSFLKWYRLHDQYVYGITKGQMKCRQQP